MCRRTTCKTCGRPDWAGCGAHVESVLGDVAEPDRCQCRTNPPAASAPRTGGLLAKLRGR